MITLNIHVKTGIKKSGYNMLMYRYILLGYLRKIESTGEIKSGIYSNEYTTKME
tara:strand:+ start:199 stop:360 length:162 start_codon:yes stop_codon:yes gene_type:complete